MPRQRRRVAVARRATADVRPGCRSVALVLCALSALAVSCSAEEPARVGAAPTGGALAGLAPCEPQPPPPSLPAVPGLRLPRGARVYSISRAGPLTQAEGVVDLTPVQVRTHYQERDDLKVLSVEDETFESEVLVTDGRHRMFVKTQVLCASGSNFMATVGSEADAAAIPTPAGSPGPPPT